MKNVPRPCNPSRLRVNCSSRLGCSSYSSCQPVSTCLLVNAQLSRIALRHCSTTRWDMSKISVPSNTALALWARSNHERLFLRRRHWTGSWRRRFFEAILINEPLCDGWLHKAEIQFRAVLKTECLECSVGHRSIHYLELPIGDPFRYFDCSDTQEFRNSSPRVPSFLLHTPAAVSSPSPAAPQFRSATEFRQGDSRPAGRGLLGTHYQSNAAAGDGLYARFAGFFAMTSRP